MENPSGSAQLRQVRNLCRSSYVQLGSFHRKAVLRFTWTESLLHDEKEWFFFPLGIFFKAIGGIPVNRDKRTSMVDQMAERFANSTQFHLAITPEGTRKANPEWKKGFTTLP